MEQKHSTGSALEGLSGLLRMRANRHALMGLAIALSALLLATLLAARVQYGSISVGTIWQAQAGNPALWLMNAMPFLFLLWGQHVGTIMAYQAGAMVLDETRGLRERTSVLEFELSRLASGPRLGLSSRADLAAAIGQAATRRERAALLVLDSPQYHDLQMTSGQTAGEELLRQMVQRLLSVLDERDFLAHYGPGDFAVLSLREDDPLQLAARIQVALDTPVTVSRQALSVRTHVGVAMMPDHGTDPGALLRHAETAKFAAAAEGRDYLAYTSRLEGERIEAPRLIAELHAALAHGGLGTEFRLQQPLQEQRGERLRFVPYWLHPRRGRLEEEEFLNLPERLSLVHALALWQLQTALPPFAAWREAQQGAELGLVLRPPAAALAHAGFAESLLKSLASHDLPPDALTIEFGEDALGEHESHARVQLRSLRTAGASLCLRNFGDAGASIATLLREPVTEVQLAPMLMHDGSGRSQVGQVLDLVVQIAKRLDLTVCASGVAHEEQRQRVSQLGCDWAEGTVVSPNLSVAEVPRWLGL